MVQQETSLDTSKSLKRSRNSTENRLLQAGLEIFSEMGFDAATTRLIAQRAQTNEALIHRYFQSKKGLLDAIILKFVVESTGGFDYPPGKDAEEELRNYLKCKTPILLQSKDFIRIMMSRAALDPELNQKLRQHTPIEGDPFLAGRLQALQDKGLIHPSIDIQQAAFNVSFYAYATLYMGQIILGKDVAYAMDDFVAVFARGLREGKLGS